MCILIDACVFAHLFDPKNKEHENFAPLLNWIQMGDGAMVTGGTKYEKELKALPKYLPIIAELARAGKVLVASRKSVDSKERELKKLTPKKFNDEHLIAILVVTGCLLISTVNKSDMKEMTDKTYYPKRRKPKIYQNKTHAKLLCEKNIASFCTG